MLDEYMSDVGYSKDEIKLIKASYLLKDYKKSDILYNLKNIFNYFHSNNIENKDIIHMTMITPSLICTSIENIKKKVLELNEFGFNKLEIFNLIKTYPYIIDISLQKIKNKFTFFLKYDFSKLQCKNIILSKPDLINLDNSYIKRRIMFFLDLGYSNYQISNIINFVPDILDEAISDIKAKIDFFLDIGFSLENVIMISSYIPRIFTISNSKIKMRISLLDEYGFDILTITKIIDTIPLVLQKKYLDNSFIILDEIKNNYLDKDELNKVILLNPYLLLLPIELFRSNINNILNNGFSNNDLKKIFLECPIIINYNSNELLRKIKFYKKKKLLNIIKNNPKYLVFNLDFIISRLNLISNKKIINDEDIFLDDISFYNEYNITRDEVLRGISNGYID